MPKHSDFMKISAYFSYGIGTVFFAAYALLEVLPGFQISTFGRLFLLLLCCGFLWLGGFLMTKQTGHNRPMRINLWIFLGFYLMLFATLTLFDPMWGRNGGFIIWNRELFDNYVANQLNLVPFRTIAEYFTKSDFRQFIVNIAGNIVCLMPLGILLPLISEKQRKTVVFLLTCTGIVASVELLQFLTLAGSCDVDDLILNVGGAFIIYLFTKNKEAMNFLESIFLFEKKI